MVPCSAASSLMLVAMNLRLRTDRPSVSTCSSSSARGSTRMDMCCGLYAPDEEEDAFGRWNAHMTVLGVM